MDTETPLPGNDWFHRLKAAQRDLIARCGGIQRAADLTWISKSQVGRWNNPVNSDLMPINAALLLERDCGHPFVTAALADLNGWRVIDPEAGAGPGGNLLRRLGEMQQAFSEVTTVGSNAAADGKITPAEAQAWDRSMSHAEQVLSEMRKRMAAIQAGEKAVPVLGED